MKHQEESASFNKKTPELLPLEQKGPARIYPFPKPSLSEKQGASAAKAPRQVSFNRLELGALLRVYGFKVAQGEWRDYAIDHLKDKAVFSIFRRACEMPLYQVEKVPALARKQGMYKVIAAGGYIMRRGHELPQVLKILEKPVRAISV